MNQLKKPLLASSCDASSAAVRADVHSKTRRIDFLTIILVCSDHMIDMFLQLCLFVYGENFIAVNDG